jgi:hypothetical protein
VGADEPRQGAPNGSQSRDTGDSLHPNGDAPRMTINKKSTPID